MVDTREKTCEKWLACLTMSDSYRRALIPHMPDERVASWSVGKTGGEIEGS